MHSLQRPAKFALHLGAVLFVGWGHAGALAQSSGSELPGEYNCVYQTHCFADPELLSDYLETTFTGEGSLGPAIAKLRGALRQDGLSDDQLAMVSLNLSSLLWKTGEYDEALQLAREAQRLNPTARNAFALATLLDAGGELDEALEMYEALYSDELPGDLRDALELRLAVIAVASLDGGSSPDRESVAAFEDVPNLPTVLALNAQYALASQVEANQSQSGSGFSDLARQIEWEILAGKYARASARLAQVLRLAGTSEDLKYGLALMAEAHRATDSLPALLEDISAAQAGEFAQDFELFIVDLLMELERSGEAISRLEALASQTQEPRLWSRLVLLLERTGEDEEIERVYASLIERSPTEVSLYRGLSVHHFVNEDEAAAKAVWQEFEQGNARDSGLLVAAAFQMDGLGLTNEALAMLQERMPVDPERLGLAAFEISLGAGAYSDAREQLSQLEQYLGDSENLYVRIADGWEQLGRPDEAIRLIEEMQASGVTLSYDDKIKLASFYEAAGRPQAAYDLFYEIWLAETNLPRLKFAERQILRLAFRDEQADAAIVRFENELWGGEPSAKKFELLVLFYARNRDVASAQATIDKYVEAYGGDEISLLNQLGRSYRLLELYPEFHETYVQLAERDAENRSRHIQTILLNLLRNEVFETDEERAEQILMWLSRLEQGSESEGASIRTAGILERAGLVDEAIASYRKAAVLDPGNPDLLLRLTEVMAGQGYADQAIAQLQYEAQVAGDDAQFVSAIDGLINLIGQVSPESGLSERSQLRLEWARRLILERLARDDTKLFFYDLLTDIEDVSGNLDRQIVALENVLPIAGAQRAGVLRQLLTLTSPGSFDDSQVRRPGDSEKRYALGRRMIAIADQLPPDAYINIANLFLSVGDVNAAETSFNLISDITGLINVNQIKGEAFLESGDRERALDYFLKALASERNGLAIIRQVGQLRELQGETELAFQIYSQGAAAVLRPLSIELVAVPDPDPSNAFGARNVESADRNTAEYLEFFIQGLIANWPRDAVAAGQARVQLIDLFDRAYSETVPLMDPSQSAPISQFRQLDRTAYLLRRVGHAVGDLDLARHADNQLIDRFAHDEAFARTIRRSYAHVGSNKNVSALIEAVAVSPSSGHSAGSTLDLIDRLSRGDSDGFHSAYELNQSDADQTALLKLGISAERRFPGLEIVERPADRDAAIAIAATLLALGSDWVGAYEEVVGFDLITPDNAPDIFAKLVAEPRPGSVGSAPANLTAHAFDSFSDEQLLDYMDSLDRFRTGGQPVAAVDRIINYLLKKPLSDEAREKLAQAILARARRADFTDPAIALGVSINLLFGSRAHPENEAIIHETARWLDQRIVLRTNLEAFSLAISSGDVSTEVEPMLDAMRTAGIGSEQLLNLAYFSTGKDPDAATNLRELGLNLSELEEYKPLARLAYQRFLSANIGHTREELNSLRQQDPTFESVLLAHLLQQGEMTFAAQILQEVVQRDDASDFLKASLFRLHALNQDYVSALSVNDLSAVDLSSEDGMETLISLAQSSDSSADPHAAIFQQVLVFEQAQTERLAQAKAAREGEGLPDTSAQVEAFGANQLRYLWRTRFNPGNPVAHIAQILGINAQGANSSAPAFAIASVDSIESALGEVGIMLRASPPDPWPRRHEAYVTYTSLIADSGMLSSWQIRREEGGDLTEHELITLLYLANQQTSEQVVDDQFVDFCARRLEDPTYRPEILLECARHFAFNSRTKMAQIYYSSLVFSWLDEIMRIDEQALVNQPEGEPIASLRAVIELIHQQLDANAAAEFTSELLSLARVTLASGKSRSLNDLALVTYGAALADRPATLAEIEKLAPGILTPSEIDDRYAFQRFMELARLKLTSRDTDEALEAFELLMDALDTFDEVDQADERDAIARFLENAYEERLARFYGLNIEDNQLSSVRLQELVFERLIKGSADLDWVSGVAKLISADLDAENGSVSAPLWLASKVAEKLGAMGRTRQAGELLRAASNAGASFQTVAEASQWEALLSVAAQLGVKLDDEVYDYLNAGGTLSNDMQAGLLRILANSNSPSTAWSTGELIAGRSTNFGVLVALRCLAISAGADEASVLAGRLDQQIQAASRLGQALSTACEAR